MKPVSCYYSCLVGLISIAFTTGSYVAHPAIDLEQLGQIGIAGPYGGISLYTDSQQLTQIPDSTASILTYTNETFQVLSSSSTNGSIYASCMMDSNHLCVGGDFMQLGSVNVSNIALIDLNTGAVSALSEGLDGPVYTLYCDTDQQRVYAGGSFWAPVAPSPQYADSLAYFGGSVAAWQNGTWFGLPWKGLNGPVNAITKNNKTGSILFGGRFDTSADGQTNYAPASQPISLSSPATISAQNSGTVNNDPSSIICPSDLDSDPWLLLDDTAGYWQATFAYSVTPSLIRFANTHMDGRGTQNFSVIALPSNTPFNFTYIDPVTHQRRSCSTNCSLSNDASIEYQDFVIQDATLASGIRVQISSWYGSGGGLASIEIFQREIFVYAVQSLNGATCGSSTNQTQVRTTGSWKSSQVSGSYQYILSTAIEASKLSSSTASIDFIPNLPESGIYEVYFYFPKCTTDCAQRTQVDVTVYPTDGNSTVTTVDLSNTKTSSTLVYSGPIEGASSAFRPYVTVGVAHNATKPKSGNAVITAQAVQFVKVPSNGTLTSLLAFTPDQKAAPSSASGNGTLTGAYGPLPDNVPYMSTVNALDASDGNIYIGGNFSYTSTNKTYQNIVLFDSTKNQLVPLTNNGLNGPVNAFYRNNADLYIGGSFQSVASGAKTVLNNVARYNTNNGSWHSLAGGVNGLVEAFYQSPSDAAAIIASGNHTGFYTDEKTTIANATAGNAWWNTSSNAWSVDGPYISGPVFGSYKLQNGTSLIVGNIKAAQRHQARGFSFINSNVSLASFPVYPDASQSFAITTGAFWNDKKNGNTTVTILGGQFALQGNVQNVALYENGIWTALSNNWQGSVNTMTVHNDYLYIGGSFTVTKGTNISSIAVYDLVNRTSVPVPDLHTDDGTAARINRILTNPANGDIVVGGNFRTAGSLTCESICVLDASSHQWNNLGDSGVGGEVLDFTFTGDKLIVAGNLTLGGTTVPIAQFDYNSNDWNTFAPVTSDAGLPGASTAVSYDSKTQKTFIAGRVNDSAYIRVWDGQQFSTPSNATLGSGSSINQITVLPVKQGGPSVNLEGSTESVLLVTGLLNLDSYGNVSSAFYDGSRWIPYFVSSATNGTAGAVANVFFQSYFPTLTITSFLPAPLVVLVSIAAALGIVFLIVFCALGVLFAKRRREAKVDPAANPASYYGKPPRRPESLLAMLDAAAVAGTLSTEEKKRQFEDETPSTGAVYQSFADTQREMTENTKTPGAALGGFTAAAAVTAAAGAVAATNTSSDIKQQEQHPDAAAPSNVYQYNNSGPAQTNVRNSYNPFRGSAVGVAVSDDNTLSVAQGGVTSSYLSQSSAVAPSIGTAAITATGLHDNLYANIDNAEPQASSAVRWTTAPAAEIGTATIDKPASPSFLAVPATAGANRSSTSSETEQAGNTVRWTNAGVNSAAAMGTAMVMPVAGAVDRESAVDPATHATLSRSTFTEEEVQASSTVRWTNYTTHSAQGVAAVRPVTMYSDVTSMLDQSDVFGNVRPSMVDDFSSDPDIARWTTAPDADNAKATAAIVAGAEAAQRSSMASTSSQGTVKLNYSPNGSRASSRQYSSNLDLSSFTLNESNDKYSGITTRDNFLSAGLDTKEASSSFTLSEYDQIQGSNATYDRSATNNDDADNAKQVLSMFSLADYNDKYAGIATNERSLSNDGTQQVPINVLATDTSESRYDEVKQHEEIPKNKHEVEEEKDEKEERKPQVAEVAEQVADKKPETAPSELSFMDHDLFKTSSFRWSDGPTPLNTSFDIKIQEASPVASPEKPSAAHITDISTETASKAMFTTSFDDLYAAASDIGASSADNASPAVHHGVTTASADDGVADVAAAIAVDAAGASAVAATLSAADSNKSSSAANNNHSVLDGRAASKRMVQDFLSSREQGPAASAAQSKDTGGNKKYHKDFQAAMEAAARNNADDLPCTEDHPNLYYAKFDFNAREHGELGFDKGDPIIVVDRSDDIWWMGYKDNGEEGPMQGVFPSNYVERAPAATST